MRRIMRSVMLPCFDWRLIFWTDGLMAGIQFVP